MGIFKIFKLCKKYNVVLSFYIIFGILYSVLLAVLPFFLQYFVSIISYYMTPDHKIPSYHNINDYTLTLADVLNELLKVILLFVACALIQMGYWVLQMLYQLKTLKHLRLLVSKKINKISLNYYQSHMYGDTLTRVVDDSSRSSSIITTFIDSVIINIFMLACLVAASLYFSIWCAICALGIIVVYILICFINIKSTRKPSKTSATLNGKLNGHITESIHSLDIINLYSNENKIMDKFDLTYKNMYKANIKINSINSIFSSISSLFNYFITFAIMLFAFIVASQTKDVSTISALLLLSSLFASPISKLNSLFNGWSVGLATTNRLIEIYNAEEEKDNSPNPYFKKISNYDINIKNLTFGYTPNKTVLHDITINIKEGMKVGIIGPTGCGKSTLMNLLMRFYDNIKGTITVGDFNIKDLSLDQLRGIYGHVSQNVWLFSGTVMENIKYNSKVSDEEIIKICKQLKVHDFIIKMKDGYKTMLRDTSSLSNGERQLITIARVAVQKRKVILLDEATSNIDSKLEEHIKNTLNLLFKNRTSIIIAHRLSTVVDCDLIVFIKNGRIVEQGTHQQLLKLKGNYAKIWNSQFETGESDLDLM